MDNASRCKPSMSMLVWLQMYPTKQEFENYLSLRLRDGRVTYHEINNTAYVRCAD